MSRKGIVHCSAALLLCAATASAQEPPSEARAPLAAAFRDSQHLADCTKAMDVACVMALSDERGYWLWNGAKFDYAAKLAHLYAAMRRKGYKYLAFDTVAPKELYIDGGRLYTFVPYTGSSNWGGDVHATRGHLLGLSRDGGDSWTFVTFAEDVAPETIRLIVPSYKGQVLD